MFSLDAVARRYGGPNWPALNVPLITKVMDRIEAHPQEHDQSTWASRTACGTTYCFAGHAVEMTLPETGWFLFGAAGSEAITDAYEVRIGLETVPIPVRARELLGLTGGEALALFESRREMHPDVERARLRTMVDQLVEAEEHRLASL